jgi:hypothetical protein
MKNWVSRIAGKLVTSLGGIPTFCEDPDDLLELPDVREAIRRAGMEVQDLDTRNMELLTGTRDDLKPIFPVTEPGVVRALIETRLRDYRWVSIGIGDVFPRFALEIVRNIPVSLWEGMCSLHDTVSETLDSRKTATLISRVLYGIDPIHLSTVDGALSLLSRVALSKDGLPTVIAGVLCSYLEQIRFEPGILTDPSSARATLSDIAANRPTSSDDALEATRILVREATKRSSRSSRRAEPVSEYLSPTASEVDCTHYGLDYCRLLLYGHLSDADHVQANRAFLTWLVRNYALVLSSSSQEVLRIASISDQIDSEVGGGKAAVFMVDGLGFPAWLGLEAGWLTSGVIARSKVRIGFAALPTTTEFSRRSFFEGRVTSSLRPAKHTERLERMAWSRRYGESGTCLAAKEESGVLDSFALGRTRVCVIDTGWDEYCHGINPASETLEEACSRWAGKQRLEIMMSEALQHGYRVFVTSDHGEALCEGIGRIAAGELAEKGSKRIRVFENDALCRRFVTDKTHMFRPPGFYLDRWPLFTSDFGCFDEVGSTSFCHGGLSLEEVLIPIVEVFQR